MIFQTVCIAHMHTINKGTADEGAILQALTWELSTIKIVQIATIVIY